MDSAAVRQTDTVQAVRETAAAQLEMHVDQKKPNASCVGFIESANLRLVGRDS